MNHIDWNSQGSTVQETSKSFKNDYKFPSSKTNNPLLEPWQINTETLQVCGFPWGGGEWWGW